MSAIDVACPHCGAPVGKKCVSLIGPAQVHVQRELHAQEIFSVVCPTCFAPAGQRCTGDFSSNTRRHHVARELHARRLVRDSATFHPEKKP